jgi:hypothetical protein
MATGAEWAAAFARQADADFRAWQAVEDVEGVCECHRLLLLQMACEKLCKAHLHNGGTKVQNKHTYTRGTLPLLIRSQVALKKKDMKGMQGVLTLTRQLAAEIEVLNPAADRNEKRPDNCEYPWADVNEVVHSPLNWSFIPSQLIRTPNGITFLKVLRAAIDDLLPK